MNATALFLDWRSKDNNMTKRLRLHNLSFKKKLIKSNQKAIMLHLARIQPVVLSGAASSTPRGRKDTQRETLLLS
jgi:hypothetical protein